MKKRVLFSLLAIFLAGFGLGGVSLAAEDCQAKINDGDCLTLEVAINSVSDSGTVVLLKDFITNSFYVAADKNFKLDLNGKSLTLNNNTASCSGDLIGSTCYDYIDGNLTILDSYGNGKIIIKDAGIMPRDGGTLTIKNGIFDTQTYSKDYMFYLGGGTLHIIDGTFNGYYNIVNCYADGELALGGTVVIDSGTFITTEDDGWNTTIMGYENSNITINGGKFTMNAANGEYAFYVGIGSLTGGVEADSAVAIINGGEFNGEVLAEDGAELIIKGGTFSDDPSDFLEDGYTAAQEGGKRVIVGPVAAIDEHKYSTVTGAISAAAAGQTIKILKAGEYTLPDTISNNITIKGNVEGVKFSSVVGSAGKIISTLTNGASFDNVTFVLTGVAGKDYKHYFATDNNKEINFENCTIDGTLYVDGNQTANFSNFKFVKDEVNTSSNEYNLHVYGNATFNSGTFENNQSRNVNLWHRMNTSAAEGEQYIVTFANTTFSNTASDTKKAAVMIHEARENYATPWKVIFTNSDVLDESKYNTEFVGGSALYGIDDILTSGGHKEDPKEGTDVSYGTEKGGEVKVTVDGTIVYSTPKKNTTHKVTFDGTGELEVADGSKVSKPATDPTKSCYTFSGWYNGNTEYDFNGVVTSDLALTAKWKNYSCGGGGSSSSSSSSSNKTGDNNTGATAESGTTADTGANTPTVDPQGVAANGYTNEMNAAYEFAYANGITTMESIEEAQMEEGLTRIAMAKMLSQYAINVLGKSPADVEVTNFTDVSADLDAEYANGVSLAYKLGIMGINMPDNKFLPYETVTRAQFGTALSRLLFGIEDGEDKYYTTHLAKLKEAGIITNDNPTLEELRGYVMLMLMRSAKGSNTVNNSTEGTVSNENTNKPENETNVEEQEVEKYFTEAYRRGQIYGRIGDLQRLLQYLGYYNGEINNTFDNNTINAVFDFQIAMGILAADDKSTSRGNVGPKTREVLNQKWAEFKASK